MEGVEPRSGKDQILGDGTGGTGMLASRWDEQYRKGRYENEEPAAFVRKVIDVLRRRGGARRLRGLYVGCGNGRNYIPLAGAGLDGLAGIDVSAVAVDRLSCRCPHLAGRVRVADFSTFEPAVPLDCIVAIQVFQHGDEGEAAGYLERSFSLLGENGLLFLRVNSAATDVRLGHRIVDRNGHGGFTVRYTEGPKRGLAVHFFAADEIRERLGDAGFEIIGGPEHDTVRRSPPQAGTWSQWEVIAVKPARSGTAR